MRPWRSPAKFGEVPTLRLEVSSYWVSSPYMSERAVKKLVDEGWDETEESSKRGRTHTRRYGEFPFAADRNRLVFADKYGTFGSPLEGVAAAQQRNRNVWSTDIGPVTSSSLGLGPLRGWQRKKRHLRVDVTIRDETRPVRLLEVLNHPGEEAERARLLALVTEVYPPCARMEDDLVVFAAEDCPPGPEWT